MQTGDQMGGFVEYRLVYQGDSLWCQTELRLWLTQRLPLQPAASSVRCIQP
jgi:hypothetical protein